MRHTGDWGRLPIRVALVAATALLALWHSSPVLLWTLRLEDELRGQGNAARLHSFLEMPDPGGRAGWSALITGEIALRAPIAPAELARCADCSAKCRLELTDGGTLAIFDAPPPESYRDALDRFAPDSRDVSLLRSVSSNWRTIDALTDRVRTVASPPRSFRYVSEGSRGVVTSFAVQGTRRHVVYAYGEDGLPARVIGLTAVSRAVLLAVLGELRVDRTRSDGPSFCRSPRSS